MGVLKLPNNKSKGVTKGAELRSELSFIIIGIPKAGIVFNHRGSLKLQGVWVETPGLEGHWIQAQMWIFSFPFITISQIEVKKCGIWSRVCPKPLVFEAKCLQEPIKSPVSFVLTTSVTHHSSICHASSRGYWHYSVRSAAGHSHSEPSYITLHQICISDGGKLK